MSEIKLASLHLQQFWLNADLNIVCVFQLTLPVQEATSRGMQWCLHEP